MGKKVLTFLLIILMPFGWAIAHGIGDMLGKKIVPPNPKLSDRQLVKVLEGAAERIRKILPIVAGDVIGYKITTHPSKPYITYHYVYPEYSSNELTEEWLMAEVYPSVSYNVCTNEDTKKLIELGATVIFSYQANDGVVVSSLALNEDVCGLQELLAL